MPDLSNISNAVGKLTSRGLTKGISDVKQAFSGSVTAAAAAVFPSVPSLPSIPGITVAAPSINIYAVATAAEAEVVAVRTAALESLSDLQSVIPTLPTSLNSIRDAIPSIQASSLVSGLSDLKNLTGGLTNLPSSLVDSAGDLTGDLTREGLENIVSEYGNITNEVQTKLGGIGSVDLTGGLTDLVDRLPGLPTSLDIDLLKDAMNNIPLSPIQISWENNYSPYNFTVSSYTYRPLI